MPVWLLLLVTDTGPLARLRAAAVSHDSGTTVLSCRVKVNEIAANGATVLHEGFFLRSPGMVRMYSQSLRGASDILIQNDIVHRYSSSDGRVHCEKSPLSRLHALTNLADAPFLSRQRLFAPNGHITSLAELLQHHDKLLHIRVISGTEQLKYRIEFVVDKAACSLVLDSQFNFLPCHFSWNSNYDHMNGPIKEVGIIEVSHFEELAPGVFFPSRCQMKVEHNNNQVYSHAVEVTDMSLDRHALSSYPGFKFPQGVPIHDHLERQIYQELGDGRRGTVLGPSGQPIKYIWNPVESDELNTPAMLKIRAASELGPTRPTTTVWWPWAILVSGAVSLLLLCWLWRRRRLIAQ